MGGGKGGHQCSEKNVGRYMTHIICFFILRSKQSQTSCVILCEIYFLYVQHATQKSYQFSDETLEISECNILIQKNLGTDLLAINFHHKLNELTYLLTTLLRSITKIFSQVFIYSISSAKRKRIALNQNVWQTHIPVPLTTYTQICISQIYFFRQITMFRKVRVAFIFGIQNL